MTVDDVDFIDFDLNFCVLKCVREFDVLGSLFVGLYRRRKNEIILKI